MGNTADCVAQCEAGTNTRVNATPDPARAVKLYQRACDGGYGYACSRIAAMYEAGTNGLPADPAKAKDYWAYGCAAHDKAACAKLSGAPAKR